MNRIDKTLADLEAAGKKMLSPYLTAGDPDPEITLQLMQALVAAGADILELGIPFSDPMAEGPVIQAAMERALAQEISCDDVLAIVRKFRIQDQQTPIVLMGYVNPIEIYGYRDFARNAADSGVDGLILVDMPPEESDDTRAIWEECNLHRIYLCSPTTSDARMEKINTHARGYIYYVSLKGVTGSSDLQLEQVEAAYRHRQQQCQLPLMVGFGIKTPEMAAGISRFADGAIVGAALIDAVYNASLNHKDPIAEAASLIAAMREAMDKSESS
ncbi:MAG: tryptophan synthase subunit alpha [Legionellaceae bacterium]|nr:tryptophan synthase subunit alpha [Legionellaceae bacterium]